MNSENIYERATVVERYDISRQIPEQILENYCAQIISITSPKKLCDVGFGRGSTLIPFSNYADIEAFGIDSSSEMTKVVNTRLAEKGLTAKVYTGDAHSLPEIINDLDLVHIKAVTHLIKDPYLFLTQVSRAIRSEGYFVIGKEFSQPEDNLENIGKYAQSNTEEPILKKFYEEYFRIRREKGNPFKKPKMPAGDYDEAVRHLTENGFIFVNEISTPVWNKELGLSELIEALEIGTFTVFTKNCTPQCRSIFANEMEKFCSKMKYDVQEVRLYPAQLKATILKKSGGLERC